MQPKDGGWGRMTAGITSVCFDWVALLRSESRLRTTGSEWITQATLSRRLMQAKVSSKKGVLSAFPGSHTDNSICPKQIFSIQDYWHQSLIQWSARLAIHFTMRITSAFLRPNIHLTLCLKPRPQPHLPFHCSFLYTRCKNIMSVQWVESGPK